MDFRIKRSKSLLSLCHFVTLSSLPGSKLRVSERKVKLAWTIPNWRSSERRVSLLEQSRVATEEDKWSTWAVSPKAKLWNDKVKAMQWRTQSYGMRRSKTINEKSGEYRCEKRRVRNGQNKELGMKKHAFMHIFNSKKTKSMIKMNSLRKLKCKRMLIVKVNKCKSSNSNFVCKN